MEKQKKPKKKAEVSKNDCVGCGSCIKVCPMGAITVPKGIFAEVDLTKCIGCGKCAKECPAGIIEITEVA